ncbi:MAG: hypothetical protein ABH874_07405 [Methanobacteriota archaeon]
MKESLRKSWKGGAMLAMLLLTLSISAAPAFAWGPINHDAIAWETATSDVIGTYPSLYYDVGSVSCDIGDFTPLPGKDPTNYNVAWRMHDRDIENGYDWYASTDYRAFTTNMYKYFAATDNQKAFTLGWRGHVRGADPVVLSAGKNGFWDKIYLDNIAYYEKGGRANYVWMYPDMVQGAYQYTYGVTLSTTDISAATAALAAAIGTEKELFINLVNYAYAKAVYGNNYANVWYPNAKSDTITQVKNLRLYGFSVLSPNTELPKVSKSSNKESEYKELEKQLGEELEAEANRVTAKLLSEGIIEVPLDYNAQTGLLKAGPIVVKDQTAYDAEIAKSRENIEKIKEKHPKYKKFKDTGKVD